MSEQESDQEKTEQPTERRLKEALEQGQLLTSRDMIMGAVLLAAALQFYLIGRYLFDRLLGIFRTGLQIHDPFARDVPLTHIVGDRFFEAITLILLFSAPLIIVAVGAQSALAGGFHFIWKNASFKTSRISPVAGLARMFGSHAVMELLKSILKVIGVGVVGALFLKTHLSEVLNLSTSPFEMAMEDAGALFLLMLLFLVGAVAIAGAADAFLQWRQHSNRLRMTKQEMKDEHKQTEGSPEVKSRIRKMQQEMTQRGSVAQVENAQVVIVNPTRFAVALRYDFEEGTAPKVLAKGTEKVALSIREKADQLGIPVLAIPPLARALYYTSDIGAEIHADLYRAVATVLSFVFQAGAAGDAPDVEIPDAMLFDANGRRTGGRS